MKFSRTTPPGAQLFIVRASHTRCDIVPADEKPPIVYQRGASHPCLGLDIYLIFCEREKDGKEKEERRGEKRREEKRRKKKEDRRGEKKREEEKIEKREREEGEGEGERERRAHAEKPTTAGSHYPRQRGEKSANVWRTVVDCLKYAKTK